MWTYRLRFVKCGKAGCHCQTDEGHGPYWYGYERRGERIHERYFGQRRPEEVPPPPKDAPGAAGADSKRWQFKGRMTENLARRILNLYGPVREKELQARWRRLIWDHHPDRGGSTDVAAAINAAYSYMRNLV